MGGYYKKENSSILWKTFPTTFEQKLSSYFIYNPYYYANITIDYFQNVSKALIDYNIYLSGNNMVQYDFMIVIKKYTCLYKTYYFFCLYKLLTFSNENTKVAILKDWYKKLLISWLEVLSNETFSQEKAALMAFFLSFLQ